ncbi:MAG: phosphoglycerate mutase [Halioglobus sp.]
MKTLCFLRHAKSSWDDPGLIDRERGLNSRGLRDAPRMGLALCSRLQPMTIRVSSARRARMTLAGLIEGWPVLGELDHAVVEDLYTFSGEALSYWISQQPDTVDPLFVIGHNPAITDVINWLLGAGRFHNIPTAGFVELHLALPKWTMLAQGCAQLADSVFPKQLT